MPIFKLSTRSLLPIEERTKRPMVTAQQKIIGQLGKRRWSDSVVAQQLIPAKITKRTRQIRRRVDLCPMRKVL